MSSERKGKVIIEMVSAEIQIIFGISIGFRFFHGTERKECLEKERKKCLEKERKVMNVQVGKSCREKEKNSWKKRLVGKDYQGAERKAMHV